MYDSIIGQLDYVPTRQNANGYVLIPYDDFHKGTQALFKSLKEIGFFAFFTTNNGYLVGLHQVVAFLSQGWKWLERGETAPQGEIEVHHYDSTPTNNRPDNLALISAQDHRLISEAYHHQHLGEVRVEKRTPRNRRGRPIKNHKHWLKNQLIATYIASARKLNCFLDYSNPQAMINVIADSCREAGYSFKETGLLLAEVKRQWRNGENPELLKLMRFNWSQADSPWCPDGYDKTIDPAFERLKYYYGYEDAGNPPVVPGPGKNKNGSSDNGDGRPRPRPGQ